MPQFKFLVHPIVSVPFFGVQQSRLKKQAQALYTFFCVPDFWCTTVKAGEVTGLESVDTVGAVFALTNPATSATTLTYTITGGTEGVDYEDEGHGSVVIKAGESSVDVPVTILDNQLRNDPPVVLTITITDATAADTETSVDGEASVLEYTIADDSKRLALSVETLRS